MTTATESVLAPFESDLEKWQGNIAPENSAYRVDGAFIFLLAKAVQKRGTHTPHGFRTTTEAKIEREWDRLVEQAVIEWRGDWFDAEYVAETHICLEAAGVKAYADRRYLALANRLLAPDRVKFSPALKHGHTKAPSIVFYRDGEPVGALAQLRPPK